MNRSILALIGCLCISGLASAQEPLYYDEDLNAFCGATIRSGAGGPIEFNGSSVDFVLGGGFFDDLFLWVFELPFSIPAVTKRVGPTQERVIGVTQLQDIFGAVWDVTIKARLRYDDDGKLRRAKGILLLVDVQNDCMGEMRFVAKAKS